MKLRSKILILTVGLIVFLGLAVIIFVKTALTKNLLTELRERGIYLTQMLADMNTNNLLTENKLNLQMALNEFKSNNSEVEYVFVLDVNNTVMAHTFKEGFPEALIPINKAYMKGRYNIQQFATNEGNIFEVSVPVVGSHAGFFYVGFSESPLQQKVTDIILFVLEIIMTVIVLGIGIAVVFASRITRPLQTLAEAAKDIGSYNLERKAVVATKDEIGQLGATFNKMTEDLKDTTVSRDYLDMMINSMIDIVMIVDKDLKIRMVNQAAEKLLGYNKEYLMGRPFTVLCGDDRTCFGNVQRLFKEGCFPNTATFYKTKEGATIPVIISASSINSGTNNLDEIVIVAKDNTEYAKVQETLRKEKDKAQNYLDVASVMLLALNSQGNITLINKRGCEILGYEEHEIIGSNWFDNFLPVKIRDDIKQVFEKIMNGEIYNLSYYENSVITRSGEERIIAWQNTLLRDNNGKVSGTLSSGEDITLRKDAEERARESQQMLIKEHNELNATFKKIEIVKKEWEKTMDCIGDMIIITNDSGEIKRVNRVVRDFVGKQYSEIIGRNWEDIIAEEGLETHTFYAGGVDLHQTSTGKWFVLNSYPFSSEDIGYSGNVITLHDATEIKRVSEKLEITTKEINDEREKLSSALERITTLILNVTHHKKFGMDMWNPHLKKCYEIKNCTKESCPCHGKEASRCWQIAGTFCGGQIQGAFAQKYKNCAECNVFKIATADPVYQIVEQFNNMMHVLEMKNKELEDAYTKLKATQVQILQSEKMASIGQLAAGVAHEINNPMGFISSNLGTLSKYLNKLAEFINTQIEIIESLNSTDASERLNELKKKLKLDYILEDLGQLIKESLEGTDRVKKIVQNLKSFSRVDEAEYKFADINECIESTLNIVWNELKYKATVTKEYGEIPQSKCYPHQLNQVFMNLLVNAAQAIEKQGEIKIKTWNGDGFINISISDSGSGIPEDKLNRIFEPFFTTKPVGKGTGLGLSITYDIVKKHGGGIEVASKAGQGTTFTVRLPVTVENDNG